MVTPIAGGSASVTHSERKDTMTDPEGFGLPIDWTAQPNLVNGTTFDLFAGIQTGEGIKGSAGSYWLLDGRYQLTQEQITGDNNDFTKDVSRIGTRDWQLGARGGFYIGRFSADIGGGVQWESTCDSDGTLLSCNDKTGEFMTSFAFVGNPFNLGNKTLNTQYSRLSGYLDANVAFNLLGPGKPGISLFANGQVGGLGQSHLYQNYSDAGDYVQRDYTNPDTTYVATNTDLKGPAWQASAGVQVTVDGKKLWEGVKNTFGSHSAPAPAPEVIK